MRNFRNYYEILGVPKGSSAAEIKKSYRKLARKYHPDMNPGDAVAEERFKDIGEAYEVLSDPTKRRQYDQFGQYWKQGGFQGAAPRTSSTYRPGYSSWDSDYDRGVGNDVDFSQFSDFQEFIDQLLGKFRTTGVDPRTTDPGYSYRPGYKSAKSTTKSPPPPPRTSSKRDAEALLNLPLERAYTGGRERIRLEDGRSLEVNMPKGVMTGQRIRLKGQGPSGGDLYLKINLSPHHFFTLDGYNIRCQLPVTPSEAALGVQVDVPTLSGQVRLTIPAGVKSGQQLRLSGKGFPKDSRSFGDQYVEIQIVVPKNPTDLERDLYEKLLRAQSFDPRENLLKVK
ncbi:heat shock protein DnaJ domain protein [Thalassoporum mexicanum PCC 7367]|uniref:DnaJ C-terminal domain-containing protein n=1 Tax=Thalassoporum mexicanum TaxID=3457544 RepID=UPI00029FDED1|nr:J domain-containing protein [Pseudanabaena sp. PCC 7367]AFY71763.1 heat shock protein DnaJ domain protein [Pseudanabaena sp. PCC 7367]